MIGLLLLSMCFGGFMKVADLLDEHGLIFPLKHSTETFGIAWGLSGALLIVLYPETAPWVLGLTIAFLLRYKLDCPAHSAAGGLIMFSGFLLSTTVSVIVLAYFTVLISIFGLIRDFFGSRYRFLEIPWYNYFGGLAAFMLLGTGIELILVPIIATIAYDAVKFIGFRYWGCTY